VLWEQRAADRLEAVRESPAELYGFARGFPKGGDLHNHLSGAVYAETYISWGQEDGNCLNGTTLAAVSPSQCAASGNVPMPEEGDLFDSVIRAWSMLDFVPGVQTGHDHFFATFGKFGIIAGAHRDDSIADLLQGAAAENLGYVETMFNLGTNVGALSASLWSGTLTAADLGVLYDRLTANAEYAAKLSQDVAAVTRAASNHRGILNCAGTRPPPACQVKVRFIAQVSRTGGNDQIFGQLVSAYEMATRTPDLVGLNLSSAEDDTASLRNYDLHMAMLDFLHAKYTVTGRSPLHVTLHAGELTPPYLPVAYADHITFHIRRAVLVGHAERIGHGLALLSETDPEGLLEEMRDRDVMVEICLSSNDQIHEVRGDDHPLARYMEAGVPVALATDDQGVSRSSMSGELIRAVRDHGLGYRQLKTMARTSLEHAFLPGASLWQSLVDAQPVPDCAPTEAMAVGDTPNDPCLLFLSTSERAQVQWDLERRFRAFEREP
jgi:hypothetical protein